ncbi:hypothetical protein BGX33_001233 [Mortierella sp. NVP41]|nr:hypothetical protein BGX33_001233 [Mortierella sp. NVP41]
MESESTTAQTGTPSLPPECIEMILQYLWDDLSTLHQLALCNRTLFSLIIPILYKSPFRIIADHRTWSDISKSQRTAKLIRLLYACSVAGPASDSSDVTPDPESPRSFSSTATETTETTAAITSPLSDDALFAGPEGWTKLPSPLTTDYLFHYTHQGLIPRISRAFHALNPSLDRLRYNRTAYEQALGQASRTLTLALFGHSPSRIQTLSMTAHQLGCILFDEPSQGISWREGVGLGSLRMLRRLELDITAIHTLTSWRTARRRATTTTTTTTTTASGTAGEWESNQGPTTEVDFPLMFIQEHQRLFRQSTVDFINNHAVLAPPVLQELVIRGTDREWTPIQLLSRIEPLEVVDLSAWNAGVPELNQIPLQRLKTLRTNLERRLDFVEVPLNYLRRCGQLEEIWMPTQETETFRWAIDLHRPIGEFVSETRLRRRRGQAVQAPVAQGQEENPTPAVAPEPVAGAGAGAGATTITTTTTTPSEESILSQLPIPALKSIRLYGGPRDLVPSLEDALDAFRDQIVELFGFEDGYSRREEYPRMQITWLVPNLSYLNLRGRFVFFFDLRCLRHCPGLRTLKLHIESNIAAPYRRHGFADVNDDDQDGQDRQDGEDPVWVTGRDYSVLAEMLWLEELQLRGSSWNIDNGILQELAGFQLEVQDEEKDEEKVEKKTSREYRPTPLADSLKYFGIVGSYKPNRLGLVPFVRTMSKLRLISLESKYAYATSSLQDAAGPRLLVECTTNA